MWEGQLGVRDGHVPTLLHFFPGITNEKDLLHSTGTPAQCYVAALVGGVWGRMDTSMYKQVLCCSPETNHLEKYYY